MGPVEAKQGFDSCVVAALGEGREHSLEKPHPLTINPTEGSLKSDLSRGEAEQFFSLMEVWLEASLASLLLFHQESTNCLSLTELCGESVLAAGYPGTAVIPLFLTSLVQTSFALPRITYTGM